MTDGRLRIVVVGGGFGGLRVARGLAQADADVVVMDARNHHLFQPLLYQVATAVLSPADIAQPIRHILRRQRNASVVLGTVDRVDLAARTVHVGERAMPYDRLVLAAGATHSYFGHDDWAAHAPGLKTIEDAVEMRRRLLLAYEAAEQASDRDARIALLTFVVVGAGPTGVELAGALKEIAGETLPADFRRIDTTTTRVVLVEAQDRVLPAMSARASARAKHDLERMGVEVRVGTRVAGVDARGVDLDGERLDAANVFWAAGVRAAPLAGTLGVALDGAGRVVVGPDCAIPGHPEAFVIGDLAAARCARTRRPVPGVAQGAMQMGEFVVGILRAEIARGGAIGSRPSFAYRDKGSMATIGRARAVADLGPRFVGGVAAWILWGAIHVAFLVGFRNRVFVMLSWMWAYLAHQKGARLITGERDDRRGDGRWGA